MGEPEEPLDFQKGSTESELWRLAAGEMGLVCLHRG